MLKTGAVCQLVDATTQPVVSKVKLNGVKQGRMNSARQTVVTGMADLPSPRLFYICGD